MLKTTNCVSSWRINCYIDSSGYVKLSSKSCNYLIDGGRDGRSRCGCGRGTDGRKEREGKKVRKGMKSE
jgi:hypothetical protein